MIKSYTKSKPKGVKRKPKVTKSEPKGAKRKPKGRQILRNSIYVDIKREGLEKYEKNWVSPVPATIYFG